MKQVNGFVTYIYRGVQYFEQPKRTHISKIEYDKNENMSTVYLKHNTIFTEILCLLTLCSLVYFIYSNSMYSQLINVPDCAYYLNKRLSLNITADSNNSAPIEYSISGVTGVLNPGDFLSFIDYTYTDQTTETITFTVNILGIKKSFSKDINVIEYQFEDGGIGIEGY